MLRAFTLVLGLGTLLVGGLACGGSNSTTTTQSTALSNTGSLPVVRMLSPQAGASVSPGQVLMLSLATENFELRPPVDVPPGDPTGFRGTLRALPTAELGAGFVKHHPDHSDAVEEDTHKDHGVRADDDVMPDHDNDHVHDHAVHDLSLIHI